jgi:epoxyqueuosine reductase
MHFVSTVEQILRQQGIEHFGFAELSRPLSFDFYRQWLTDGQHADMNYLVQHADLKEQPRQLAPRAHSAIVVAMPYVPHPYSVPTKVDRLKVAAYAQGEDYHRRFLAQLRDCAQLLSQEFKSEEFLCFTDSGPILERDLAYRAGLGWFGKNTCLLNQQRGSYFFLGEIITSLPLQGPEHLAPDLCGTCDRCIQACPTGALEQPRRLNANKCIAYWTIEARGNAPEPLRHSIEDWFFGCDICQSVCPWNEKHHGKELLQNLAHTSSDAAMLEADLRWVLTSSHREIERQLGHTPLIRARPLGLKRNACVVIGNRKIQALKGEVEQLLTQPKLKEVATWCLKQLPC